MGEACVQQSSCSVGVWLTHSQTHTCQCVIRERSHSGGELLKVSCGDTSGSNLWPFTSPLSYGTKLSLVTEVNIRSSASTHTPTHTLPVDLQHWKALLIHRCSVGLQLPGTVKTFETLLITKAAPPSAVVVMRGMASKHLSHVDLSFQQPTQLDFGWCDPGVSAYHSVFVGVWDIFHWLLVDWYQSQYW